MSMIEHLDTEVAKQDMERLAGYLTDMVNLFNYDYWRSVVEGPSCIPSGTSFYRITRGNDENDIRRGLGKRASFFAHTKDVMEGYSANNALYGTGRVVRIHAVARRNLRAATANQRLITEIICQQLKTKRGLLGPFPNLIPNFTDDDMDTIRIQRWISPSVVASVLRLRGHDPRFSVLMDWSRESLVFNPIRVFDLEFQWD